MRWDNLRLDEPTSIDASAPDADVPLFARSAVTRTFDTPGFRGMTFYEVHAKSIVSRVPAASRMPFTWTINPYRGCQHACSYCYARSSHNYLELDAGHDFDSKVVVKVNAPQLLRAKLASPGWAGDHIAMGTNVDCYQRAEGRYQLMRGIIAALRDAANPFSILTKGTLILRDLDLLLEAADVTDVGLNVSAGFVDKELWRAIEPGTPAPERRLEACAALVDSGLGCGVLMGPVVPYLSDSPAQLEAAVRQAAAAGAAHVTPIVLHLRPGTREWFMGWLQEAHPRLLPRYAELYGRGAYAPRQYQERITGQVRELARKYGVGRQAGRPHRNPRAIMAEPASRPHAAPSDTPLVAHEQLTLLLPRNVPSNSTPGSCAVTDVATVTQECNGSVPGRPQGAPEQTPHHQACLKTFDLFVLRALEPRRRARSGTGRYLASRRQEMVTGEYRITYRVARYRWCHVIASSVAGYRRCGRVLPYDDSSGTHRRERRR